MNRIGSYLPRRKNALLFSLAHLALAGLALRLVANSQTADAHLIMQGVHQQDDSHDAMFRADFEVFDRNNKAAKKQFVYRRVKSPESTKILVVFSNPPEIRGVKFLSTARDGSPAEQYMYTPALRRVRDIAPQERSGRFIGTDFTFEDISEHPLDDFVYKLLSDNETMENHKVYKIAATPVDSDRSQYKFVYYWVAQDVPVILFTEMYDAQGKEVRTLHASGLKRVDDIWGARRMELSSVQEGTRTVLTIDEVKFNSGLDERLFSPNALEDSH